MSEERETRHRARMIRKKTVVDTAIARATISRGLVLVLTGNGKGKSSSAYGMVARALGHGMNVAVFQFIKGSNDTGEYSYFIRDPNVSWERCGEGFTWETQDRQRDIAVAIAGWEKAQQALTDPAIGLIVLNEMSYLFKYGYLSLENVLSALAARPVFQHVVMTGLGAPAALVEYADTVSEMADVKHAFRHGIAAQTGVDL